VCVCVCVCVCALCSIRRIAYVGDGAGDGSSS